MIHYVTFTSGKYLGQKYSYDYWMSHTNFVTKKGDTQTYQSLGRDINDLCLSELLLEAFLFTPTKKRKRERDRERERGGGGEKCPLLPFQAAGPLWIQTVSLSQISIPPAGHTWQLTRGWQEVAENDPEDPVNLSCLTNTCPAWGPLILTNSLLPGFHMCPLGLCVWWPGATSALESFPINFSLVARVCCTQLIRQMPQARRQVQAETWRSHFTF